MTFNNAILTFIFVTLIHTWVMGDDISYWSGIIFLYFKTTTLALVTLAKNAKPNILYIYQWLFMTILSKIIKLRNEHEHRHIIGDHITVILDNRQIQTYNASKHSFCFWRPESFNFSILVSGTHSSQLKQCRTNCEEFCYFSFK